jgi:RNA polymerase sigma-70 factor (ECF subfamily)
MLSQGSNALPALLALNIVSQNDEELAEKVKRAQEGDEAAFDCLFQAYNTRICTYLLHMVGNMEEAHDLAQETFLKAWKALSQTTQSFDLRFDSWLYRIATHTAIDYLRSKQFRWLRFIQRDQDAWNRVVSPDNLEERVAEYEHIMQALAQVTAKYRACLLLQVEAGLTQKEIAHLLKSTEKSVSVYVSRGREQFRQAYVRLAAEQTTIQRRPHV